MEFQTNSFMFSPRHQPDLNPHPPGWSKNHISIWWIFWIVNVKHSNFDTLRVFRLVDSRWTAVQRSDRNQGTVRERREVPQAL